MGAAEIDIQLPAAAPIPARVGRYAIRGEIATGGMATVYLGVSEGDTHPGALRAIKRVHPHLARQREFIEMFVDEARLASRIRHENVGTVFEWGEADGTFFLAMELLLGEPLIAVLRRLHKVPEVHNDPQWDRCVARIVADACAGLHAAHELCDEQGEPLMVVHRDVSPQNLFVTWDGMTKVVDFGVASAKHRIHQTTTGTVKGKFAYMAPEQLRGEPVDRRADVWSLGVVLWELLAGRTLFRRSVESETIVAVLDGRKPSLREFRKHVSPELEAIATRALVLDREKRTSSAAKMRDELQEWLRLNGECSVADVATAICTIFPEEREASGSSCERAIIGASAITPRQREEETLSGAPAVSSVPQRQVPQRQVPRRRAKAVAAITLALAFALTWGTSTNEEAPETISPEVVAAAADSSPATSAAVIVASDSVAATASASAPGSISVPSVAPAQDSEAVAVSPIVGASSSGEHHHSSRSSRRRSANVEPATIAAPAPSADDDDGSGVGQLDVATPGGWAEVWLDGTRLGHTPGRFRLPEGHHSLIIRPGNGGAERRVEVRIVGGQLARLRVDIQP